MIRHPHLDELRDNIKHKNDDITERRIKWIKRNPYFYKQLIKTLNFAIPEQSSVLHIRSSIGYILNRLNPSRGVGIDSSEKQIEQARKSHRHLEFKAQNVENIDVEGYFDSILISSTEDIVDIKAVLESIKQNCHDRTRVVFTFYNYGWHWLVKMAEKLRLKIPQKMHNWVAPADLHNILELSGYEQIYNKKFVLIPFNIPIISYLLNRFVARLPIFRHLCMMNITVARLVPKPKQPSVSIIIPCRNEAGNIEPAVERIPQLAPDQEIIFGDDKSTDGTPDIVRKMAEKYPEKNIRLVDSPGINKASNVWTCFDAAEKDVLMILDADLTVIPEELPYFYEAISKGYGEFINGSRLLYPMHDEAMRFFNVLGNKFFSLFFSYILDTKIKDTLCGTKVLYREDFKKIKELRGTWGVNDRWGDYELIFGAAKTQLKLIDLPVHYMERTYGETKMTGRIKNGLVMLRMSFAALMKIKFY
ncbi:glycosyltransferase [bacterium]|nr:glycosyltransferase [bacterium]